MKCILYFHLNVSIWCVNFLAFSLMKNSNSLFWLYTIYIYPIFMWGSRLTPPSQIIYQNAHLWGHSFSQWFSHMLLVKITWIHLRDWLLTGGLAVYNFKKVILIWWIWWSFVFWTERSFLIAEPKCGDDTSYLVAWRKRIDICNQRNEKLPVSFWWRILEICDGSCFRI